MPKIGWFWTSWLYWLLMAAIVTLIGTVGYFCLYVLTVAMRHWLEG